MVKNKIEVIEVHGTRWDKNAENTENEEGEELSELLDDFDISDDFEKKKDIQECILNGIWFKRWKHFQHSIVFDITRRINRAWKSYPFHTTANAIDEIVDKLYTNITTHSHNDAARLKEITELLSLIAIIARKDKLSDKQLQLLNKRIENMLKLDE